MNIKSHVGLLWLHFASLVHWSTKLTPSSEAIRSTTKTNYNFLTRVFPRFKQFAWFYSEIKQSRLLPSWKFRRIFVSSMATTLTLISNFSRRIFTLQDIFIFHARFNSILLFLTHCSHPSSLRGTKPLILL